MNHVDGVRLERRADALAQAESDLKVGLIELRKKHGLTQRDIAERLLVSQSRVAQFERYDSNPTLDMIMRYALAVEARIDVTVDSDRGFLSQAQPDRHMESVRVPSARVRWETSKLAAVRV